MVKNKMVPIIFIILGFIILLLNHTLGHTYIYEKYTSGSEKCKELRSIGYFETEYDTAGHFSCAVNLKTGEDTCNYLQNHFTFLGVNKTNCFSYDKYDFECNEQLLLNDNNLSYYGSWCVWGSAGYFILVFYLFISFLAVGIIGIGIIIMFCSNQDEIGE